MRRLNSLLRPLALLIVGVLFLTCEEEGFNYRPPKPVDETKPVDESWRPRVLKATLSGVPDENIAVDTASRTLTVTLPENYSVLRANMNLTLSCDSCQIKSTPNKTLLPVYFPSINRTPDQPFQFELTRTGYDASVFYTLRFKPSGPLQIGFLTEPLVAERGGKEYVLISVANYLDGLRPKVTFTNKQTGTLSEGYVNFCENTSNDCSEARADRVWISIFDLLPGEYTIRLSKADGREAVANQSLIVRRGKLRFDGAEPVVSGAQTTKVYGFNLYADHQYELLVSNATGYSARLPVVNVSANSYYAEAVLPPTIAPGYYQVQLAESANSLPTLRRFTVLRSAQQPYLTGWRDSLANYVSYYLHPSQPTTTPIELTAGRTQYVNVNRFSPILKHEIRLTPVAGDQPAVSIPIKIDSRYFLLGTEGSTNTFRVPTTVQPGRYRLTLLTYRDQTTFEESEPLEHEIRIR